MFKVERKQWNSIKRRLIWMVDTKNTSDRWKSARGIAWDCYFWNYLKTEEFIHEDYLAFRNRLMAFGWIDNWFLRRIELKKLLKELRTKWIQVIEFEEVA